MSRSNGGLRVRVAGLAIVLAVLGALVPTVVSAAAPYAEYHDRTAAQETAKVTSLMAAGYRPLSLSISGDAAGPRYAATWVHRSGPSFRLFHGRTRVQYEALLDDLDLGEHPVIVTATGSGVQARFAGVIEHGSTPYVTRQDMDADHFQVANVEQRDAGFILRSAAAYGSVDAPLYAGIWEKNAAKVGHGWSIGLAAGRQTDAMAAYRAGGARPTQLAVGPTGTTSIWHDDRTAGGWKASVDLTKAQLETRIASLASGWRVEVIAGAGIGTSTRYAAIFSASDQVLARQWHVTGVARPALSAFDTWVRNLMRKNQIRAGQLAIVRKGRLVYARGYTWAEPGYHLTQPTDLFRIGSTDKPLTSIVINRLIQDGDLALEDTMQSILDLHPQGGGPVADSRWNDVTVEGCLSHAGGWNRGATFDPLFYDDVIAESLGTTYPVAVDDILAYMAGQPLQFDPGTNSVYSNLGYMMLRRIIEAVRPGHTYAQTVRDFIFDPLGLTRPTLGASALSGRLPHEVLYDAPDPEIHTTVLNASGDLVPTGYGDFRLENATGVGRSVMSAPDYARILAAFDETPNPLLNEASVTRMWSDYGVPGLLRGWYGTKTTDKHGHEVTLYHHNGSLPGTAALVIHRSDGYAFVLLFNRRVDPYLWGGADGLTKSHGVELSNLANAVTKWPTGDLFPTYGIPAP